MRASRLSVAELSERIRTAPPMTPEQRFEQRVSWAFGQCAVDCDPHLSLEEVRTLVRRLDAAVAERTVLRADEEPDLDGE